MTELRWWRAVRVRVTAAATLAAAVVLLVTAILLVAHQRDVLTETLDETLTLEAADLARTDNPPTVLNGVIDDDGVAQVVRGGRVVAATRNLTGRPPIAGPPPGTVEVRTVERVLATEPAYRVLSRRVATSAGPAVFHVGASTEDVDETTAMLARSLSVGVPAVVAVLAVLVWVLVGRTLAPVEAIRARVAGIGADDLHQRIPVPATGDEIGRLAETMNGMLERLDETVARQRHFVADASHELRSPLTRIRTELEVDLASPGGTDASATHRSVLEEVTDLERLVDDLLLLARADAGAALATRPVDLDDVVLRCVRLLRDASPIEVDTTGVSAAQVQGDERQLARAVSNVLDNAARHARSRVVVAVAEVAGEAVLTVTDDGPGVPADRREAVFERFTRLDDARTRAAGGTGLGLAITRDILQRHGGTVVVDPDHHGGGRLVLRLPLG